MEWTIFLWKFQRGERLTFPCANGKSKEVGVLLEIPSVVGVWIFSGNTQFTFINQEEFYFKSCSTYLTQS